MAVQGVFGVQYVLLGQCCVKAMAQYSRTKSEAWRRRRFCFLAGANSTSRAPLEQGSRQPDQKSHGRLGKSKMLSARTMFLRYLMHGVGNFSIAGGEDPGLGSTCWHTVPSKSVSDFGGKTGRQEHLMNERGQQSR